MQHTELIHDLAVLLCVAAGVLILFRLLRLPVVIGYILAGFLIGPHALPLAFIKNQYNIHTLSELGVIFLLFNLGLEFSLRKLREVGNAALLAGAVEIGGMLLIGNFLGRLLGWSPVQSFFLGAALAISSTTIILKVVNDLNLGRKEFTRMIFGMLIIEDLAAIILLATLTGISSGPSLFGPHTALIVVQFTMFLVASLVFGLMLVPRFMTWVERFQSDELVLITTLGLCLGFSALVNLLGYSVALGAFLMGALLAESRAIARIGRLMPPLRDLFCAVFFVSVGLRVEPEALAQHTAVIILIAVVLISGKALLCTLGAFVAGTKMKDAFRVGAGMTQIGEFSFVIIAMGVSQNVVEDSLFPVIVSVSILTTLTTPWFIKGSKAGAVFLEKHSPKFLLSYLNLYYDWTSRFNERRQSNAVQQILQRILLKLAIFCCLIAGAFLMALFLARFIPTVLTIPEFYVPWMQTGLWLTALILTMPVILASLRKLKALSMILAELGITESVAGPRWREIRNVLTSFFYLLGVGVLIIYGMLLSSVILPPKALFLLAGITIPLAWLLRDAFNKIYFQGKAAIMGPLGESQRQEKRIASTGPPSPSANASKSPVAERPQVPPDWESAYSLKNVLIIQLPIREDAPVANQKINETPLVKNTAASILAVQRPGALRIHPGPEEELKPGDEVLLLGEPSGLAQIRPIFEPQSSSPSNKSESPITKVLPIIKSQPTSVEDKL